MDLHIHQLEQYTHQTFLSENRRDPLTQERLRPGDEIVICANDKIAHLLGSWRVEGRCPVCKHTKTLSSIPNNKSIGFLGNSREFKQLSNKIEELASLISSQQSQIDSRLQNEFTTLNQQLSEFQTKLSKSQQRLAIQKQEILRISFLPFVTRLISLLIVGLILFGDYHQSSPLPLFRLDVGAVIIGIVFITLLTLSLRSRRSKNTSSPLGPTIGVLLFGIGFCVLSIWGWKRVLTEYSRYFHQIVIVALFIIPFGTYEAYRATWKSNRYVAVPCIGAFLGFVLGTTYYFTFVETMFVQWLLKVAEHFGKTDFARWIMGLFQPLIDEL